MVSNWACASAILTSGGSRAGLSGPIDRPRTVTKRVDHIAQRGDQGDQCVDGVLGGGIQFRGSDMQRRYIHPLLVEITHQTGSGISKCNVRHPTVHLRAFAFPRRGLRLHDLA